MTKSELDALARALADESRLIEAGWIALRVSTVTPTTRRRFTVEEMRNAFFAGAQHLFASLLSIMEPGAELTANDTKRFDLIREELETFLQRFRLTRMN